MSRATVTKPLCATDDELKKRLSKASSAASRLGEILQTVTSNSVQGPSGKDPIFMRQVAVDQHVEAAQELMWRGKIEEATEWLEKSLEILSGGAHPIALDRRFALVHLEDGELSSRETSQRKGSKGSNKESENGECEQDEEEAGEDSQAAKEYRSQAQEEYRSQAPEEYRSQAQEEYTSQAHEEYRSQAQEEEVHPPMKQCDAGPTLKVLLLAYTRAHEWQKICDCVHISLEGEEKLLVSDHGTLLDIILRRAVALSHLAAPPERDPDQPPDAGLLARAEQDFLEIQKARPRDVAVRRGLAHVVFLKTQAAIAVPPPPGSEVVTGLARLRAMEA